MTKRVWTKKMVEDWDVKRCFVCFTGDDGTKICGPCWHKHYKGTIKYRKAVKVGLLLYYSDMLNYLETSNNWPVEERVANIIKYGPMPPRPKER